MSSVTLKNNAIAIYRQIIDFFKLEIASGRIAAGERIDSIRNLALEFKVNPNTVQKALNELEREGLIETDRTNGKFVTDNQDIISSMRNQLAEGLVSDFVLNVQKLGMSRDHLIELIEKELEREHG